MRASPDAIKSALVTMVSRHAGVGVGSVRESAPIWSHFPVSEGSYREHPSVTAFVDEVHSTFNVWLTEEEWDEPSLDSLSQRIRAKRETPSESIADWRREREASRKGLLITMLLMALLFGPAALLAVPGSWMRRVGMASALVVGLNALILLVYWLSTRRLRRNPPVKL